MHTPRHTHFVISIQLQRTRNSIQIIKRTKILKYAKGGPHKKTAFTKKKTE